MILTDALLRQRGQLLCWVPVCLGIGIGWYFALKTEPGLLFWMSLGVVICALIIAARVVHVGWGPVVLALALIATGAGLAKFRTQSVAAPVLEFRYYGPIQGRVVAIDRSSSDAPRLTLDQVVLARMNPARTPKRVRVSLHGDQAIAVFQPGETLILTGHLSPPSGPAEPGGYDFQRHAWFSGLGAVGYTRTPVLRLAESSDALTLRIVSARIALSRAVQTGVPGEAGAFAAAIMSGDRSAMSKDTLNALRQSNLAHLLAISGLHMGLLTAFVFTVVRSVLVLIPGVGLHLSVKKIAAVFALIAGAFYLALSGGNVATERAYIMVAVMFFAVLLGRRALTLRAVAMAAIIVLVLHPEALTGPGFQMSFSATTALVAVFGALRRVNMHRLPKWLQPVLAVVISSFVAGLATAPFAAAHFNQIAHYGLIANLLSVPLMGILIMPAAVLAVCLAPLGLWDFGLWIMAIGLRWIIGVAKIVSAQEGAVGHIVSPHWAVLPTLTMGLLWMLLWRGRARVAGLVGVAIAATLWMNSTRPALLVADTGSLLGQMTPEGRALSKPRGSSFVAGVWLENDGAPVAQDVAASRTVFLQRGRVLTTDLGPWRVLQTSGKTAREGLAGCGGADVVIMNTVDEAGLDRPCLVYDLRQLRQSGSLAFSLEPDAGLRIITARSITGLRPWNWHRQTRPNAQAYAVRLHKDPL